VRRKRELTAQEEKISDIARRFAYIGKGKGTLIRLRVRVKGQTANRISGKGLGVRANM